MLHRAYSFTESLPVTSVALFKPLLLGFEIPSRMNPLKSVYRFSLNDFQIYVCFTHAKVVLNHILHIQTATYVLFEPIKNGKLYFPQNMH